MYISLQGDVEIDFLNSCEYEFRNVCAIGVMNPLVLGIDEGRECIVLEN